MTKTLSQAEPGEKFLSASKVLTAGEEELFCAITENNLPIFLNDKAAQAKGWPGRIVPGVFTLSCSVGLMEQSGLLDDVLAYMAVDELRFIAPVKPGDTIHVEVELLSKRLTKAGDKGLVNYQWTTFNQEGKPVLRAKNTCMFKVGFLEQAQAEAEALAKARAEASA